MIWLDAVLARTVAQRRARSGDEFRGLFISEGEIDELIRSSPLGNGSVRESYLTPNEVSGSPFEGVARRCGLSGFERGALLLALAFHLDRRYGRLFAYLQDDMTRPAPTPGLALELFCGSFETRMRERAAFGTGGRLRLLGLVRLDGDDEQPLLTRAMSIDEALVPRLLGFGDHAPGVPADGGGLAGGDQVARPELILATPASRAFDGLKQAWAAQPLGLVPLLAGEDGSGRRLSATHLAAAVSLPLIQSIFELDASPARVVRRAALAGAALCLSGCDGLFAETPEARAWLAEFAAALEAGGVPAVLTATPALRPPVALAGRPLRRLHLPPLSTSGRAGVWLNETRARGLEITESQAALLAATYRLSGGQVREAVARAAAASDAPATLEGLSQAARGLSTVSLGRLGSEIPARFGWDDLVLPVAAKEALHELVVRVRHQGRVFDEWGFGARQTHSRSLSALFSGPSGTGKTMAAEVIATELGLPLYRVDLSMVVSKYIGETEKNLGEVFADASKSGAILFFDEADALFGRRSEVRDAHDRYANLEVSYLLQRMEDYDGIVILASNLRQNMDEAFVRRLHITVDFPFPDSDSRLEIWRKTMPPSAPLAADVDFESLARRFRLSGGHIRNAVITAAFLAAADEGEIGMRHCLAAVRREHQKIGKLLIEAHLPGPRDTEGDLP